MRTPGNGGPWLWGDSSMRLLRSLGMDTRQRGGSTGNHRAKAWMSGGRGGEEQRAKGSW